MVNPPIANRVRHRGPSLGVLGIVYLTLCLASLVVTGIMAGGAHFPTPFSPLAEVQAYYLRHRDAVRAGTFLQFGSAIPLGIFTATVTSRLKFLGINVAGVSIALFGGCAASILLAVSALAGWTLSQPGIAEQTGSLRAMQLLAFAAGGVGYVAPLGLLLAGVSVPCWFTRFLPRWLVWMGLIVAAFAELATLSMVLPQASILIPLARFPAFIWMIGVAFALPTSRDAHGSETADTLPQQNGV
jgi:hypothetical protein